MWSSRRDAKSPTICQSTKLCHESTGFEGEIGMIKGEMIRGSCLCGGVTFEVTKVEGPFEVCHCNRCRKLSGAAAMPSIGVRALPSADIGARRPAAVP